MRVRLSAINRWLRTNDVIGRDQLPFAFVHHPVVAIAAVRCLRSRRPSRESCRSIARASRGGEHLQVTITLDTLLQRAGSPAADLEFSPPISSAGGPATESREGVLACDCNVTRILLGSDSGVIDVGRSKRVISPAQKRALNVRDKGCRFPGCDRPAT